MRSYARDRGRSILTEGQKCESCRIACSGPVKQVGSQVASGSKVRRASGPASEPHRADAYYLWAVHWSSAWAQYKLK